MPTLAIPLQQGDVVVGITYAIDQFGWGQETESSCSQALVCLPPVELRPFVSEQGQPWDGDGARARLQAAGPEPLVLRFICW